MNVRWLRLSRHACEEPHSGFPSVKACGRVGVSLSKQKITSWCVTLEDFKVPNTIQPRDYSKGGATDGLPHIFFVANVNLNDDGQPDVNVNRLSNDNVWNAENHHRIVVPKLAVSPVVIRWEFCLSLLFLSLVIAILFSSRQAFCPLPPVSL